jgi:hypothetical protein
MSNSFKIIDSETVSAEKSRGREQLIIREVENGWTVTDENPSNYGRQGLTWVATTKQALSELIASLV